MVLTQQELIGVLRHEIHVLTHLCTKIQPEMVDYRPTPKQRSTIELLRYLTVMGPALVPSIKAGAFDANLWTSLDARAKEMSFTEIEKDLAGQADFYATAIGAFTSEELRGEIELFGNKCTRGVALINFVVAGHAAYRTQLFCYLKSCGREELNTMNLWAGVDGAM